MRILFVLLFLLTTSVQSNTLPTKEGKIFWDENLQESYEGTDFNVGLNNSAGYLGVDGHDILSVLLDNKYLFTSDFPVGIIDAGFYKDHTDFHNFVKEVLSTKSDSHGTGVASVFSVSEIQNNLGTHGVVNAKSLILDYSSDGRTNLSNYMKYNNSDVKIITQSMTLNVCTSYRAFDENRTCWSGGNEYNKEDMINHVEALAPIRQHFIDNPDTLFVLSAGNESVDASWMNGAVHYRYVAAEGSNPEAVVFEPLDNLFVVAAVGYDGVLHNYSDYGESVDLAVISGVLAASCVDENGNYYAADNTEDGYGIYRQNSDLGNSGAPCDSTGHGNGNNAFNGTSAAAPIAAGMSALLFSMNNSLSPSEVKQYLTENGANAELRYTGTCDNKGVCSTQQLSKTSKASIRIPNLNQTYGKLKIKFMLEARTDSRLITDLDIPISNNLDCSRLWSEGGSKRSVRSLNKDYEPLFYGNKCLYFRGNSFIIEYDIPTKQAKHLYYGDNHYDEYQTVRKFIKNMKSAKTDETWRQGYGIGLNEHGNIACLSADGSACTQPLTTPQQCEDIWEALTGLSSKITNTVISVPYENLCLLSNELDNKIISYNSINGKVSIDEMQIDIFLKLSNFVYSMSYFGLTSSYNDCLDILNKSGISLDPGMELSHIGMECELKVFYEKTSYHYYFDINDYNSWGPAIDHNVYSKKI